MRRAAALIALLAVAGACADGGSDGVAGGTAAGGPTTVSETATPTETLRVVDPVTDNYKACFNADPAAFEGRTWLAVEAVAAGDVTYAPADGTAATADVDADTGLELAGSDGSTATLRAETAPSPTAATTGLFRLGADGRFGYLGTVASREALATDDLVVTLTLVADGTASATAEARYSLDPALADDPPGTPEHGGPGGRWSVDGTLTSTDFELAPYTC